MLKLAPPVYRLVIIAIMMGDALQIHRKKTVIGLDFALFAAYNASVPRKRAAIRRAAPRGEGRAT